MIDNGSATNGRRSSFHSPADLADGTEECAVDSAGSRAGEDSRPDLMGPLIAHLAELREYAGLYCTARLDHWRISAQEFGIKAAFGLIGAICGLTAMIVASALCVNGLATGIGLLCGGRIWLGQILLGGGLMLIAFGSLGIVMRSVRVAQQKRLVNKYETRK